MKTKKYYEIIKMKHEHFYFEGALDHFNERIRIDYYLGNVSNLIERIEKLAKEYQYTKLIIKTRKEHLYSFLQKGYMIEALVKGYFQGSDAFFVTKYNSLDRRNSLYWSQGDDILEAVLKSDKLKEKIIPEGYHLRRADKKDAKKLANLYGQVFQVYPTPLNEAAYVEKTMDEDTIYWVYEKEGIIVSAASAEIDFAQRNAELTNCATLVEHRKHGLMKEIMKKLEQDLVSQSIYCSYTIARSLSYGMNAAFHQLGYMYTGRMTNNCYIYDKLEDMNIWVKDLSEIVS
ncbi:putative beta-lysine N-acetyltransferase [Gottfriedia solisilvae]|uniref:Putative beta-lysine N-acetyltransferase n=1 Tax=Gottfriedia solisilvae TaxID=1516104 RepID=A0A8J3F2F6_9BACI|nr:putative beta-lysine N-acetyltransferase [Gottfriedia solisilvae]GGI17671.1 putative beta-lysine N-acetyltransferase [Gottfriedia solisilvae]